MFEKKKIAIAIAVSMVALVWGVANANTVAPEYPAGTSLTDGSTVSELNPTFVFPYNAAMSGVIVDLTEGVDDADGSSVADTADVDECGSANETVFVPLADMNCSAVGCEWIPSMSLKNKASYYINYEEFVAGAATVNGKGNCKEDQGDGITFKVDTDVTTVPAPTAPPTQVEITTTGDCNAVNESCKVVFKHDNAPAASHYRVWIEDKNNVQIDEMALSAKTDPTDATKLVKDINGWFEVTGVPATTTGADGGAAITCGADLAGERTCTLEIYNRTTDTDDHPAMASMVAGSKVKVWIRAWNAKGYALWSDSVELGVKD